MSKQIAEGVETSEFWGTNMSVFFPPPEGKRNGRWLTATEIAEVIEQFGRSYVAHFQPEWARGGER